MKDSLPNMDEVVGHVKEALIKATPAPWKAEENEMSWDLYGLVNTHLHPMKIIKAPKQSKEFAEYWPTGADAEIIVNGIEWLRLLIEEREQLKAENARLKTCQSCGGQGFVELSHDPYYSEPCECVVFDQVLEEYPKLKVKVAEQDKEMQLDKAEISRLSKLVFDLSHKQ